MFDEVGQVGRQMTHHPFAGIALIGSVLLAGCVESHPSDGELARRFGVLEGVLSNCVARLQEDRVIGRIEWTGSEITFDAKSPVPPEIAGEFKAQLSSFHSPCSVLSMEGGKQVLFIVSTRGIAVSGSAKGFAYQDSIPDRLVNDTDSGARANRPFTVFKQLGPNWYIFYSQ